MAKETKKMIAILGLLVAILASLLIWKLIPEKKEEEPSRFYWVTSVELTDVQGIPVIQSYIPYDSPRRPGEVRAIEYIIIHETDNRSWSADAAAHNTFLTTNTADLNSWHYTVDDSVIYHNLPDNEVSWNAGDNRTMDGGNINGIAIEMCVNLGNDYETTLRNTAMLVAKLMDTYDLTLEDVKLHQDFSGKVCPHRLITENRVQDFYEMIRQEFAQYTVEETAKPQ